MKIVCAASLAMGREAFSTLGEVNVIPEKSITPAIVRDADAIITRSKTKIDRALLDGSKISFVGTATAGTDHMDLAYLEAKGIAWTAAPGCNANSVAEYVVAALLCLAHRHGFTLHGKTIAVIGVGHIGKLVVEKAGLLGLRVLLNDPPRFDKEGDDIFRPLDEVLPRADVVTLHVPLSDVEPHATRRIVNESFVARMKPGSILLNASRGEVADTATLLAGIKRGAIAHAVLDVFENEPAGPRDLLARADLITPHIAGYSYEAKVNGTHMVYRSACEYLGIPATWAPPQPAGLAEITVSAAGRSDEDVLGEVVRKAYDIEADDAALRSQLEGDDATRGRHFEFLRAHYPVRHEFRQRTVRLENAAASLSPIVAGLGFQSLEK